MSTCVIVTLLTALSVYNAAVGDQRLVCPESIQVPEGAEVTLRCSFDPKLALGGVLVEVRRDDLPGKNNIVHLYRDGRDDFENQMTEYRYRTTLDRTSGTVTLNISSVQKSDSGLFKFFIPKLYTWSVINVTVEAKDPKRLDSITTVPPTSEDPGAEKKTDVWMILRSRFGLLAVVVLVAAFLLWRCKVIDKRQCTGNHGDQRELGEASIELMANNNKSEKSSEV